MSRGAGRVYQVGRIWHFAFYHRGVDHRRSANTTSRTVAERQLREFIKQIGAGHNPSNDSVTFAQMIERVKLDRQMRGRRTHDEDQRAAHLTPFFGSMRAPEITTEAVQRYVASRQDEGAAPATINRELALLRRAFTVSEIARKPQITTLREDNARRDFLDYPDFQRVLDAMAPEFRDFYSFLYFSSWRQGQVAALEWRDIDIGRDEVTARGETTKNGLPHRIPLTGELREIIERARAARRLDCPFVFHREGQPIRLRGSTAPMRKAWRAACAAAGFAGHVPHCLRRSGVRNMVRAGIDPTIAMSISGHRTASMFTRYNIITTDDQRAALERTMQHLESDASESKVRSIR